MGRDNYTTERIIVKLREVEVRCGQGKTIVEAVRHIGVTEQTCYRWRKKYGGMTPSDAKKFRELEKEKDRLKKPVADLSLDNAISKDIAEGNLVARPNGGRLQRSYRRSTQSASAVHAGPYRSPREQHDITQSVEQMKIPCEPDHRPGL